MLMKECEKKALYINYQEMSCNYGYLMHSRLTSHLTTKDRI